MVLYSDEMIFHRIFVPKVTQFNFPFYKTEGENNIIVSEETYRIHNLNYTILSWDEKRRLYFETKGRSLNSNLRTNFEFFGDFRDNDEINFYMDSLLGDGVYKLELKDKTYEKNSIFAYKFNKTTESLKPKLNLLISGTLHAREWLSPMTCVYIAKLLKTNTSILDFANVFIIPVLNVDGYKYTWSSPTDFLVRYWRKNRQIDCEDSNEIGIDLNRNFNSSWGLDDGSSENCISDIYRGTSVFSASEAIAVKNFVEDVGIWDGHIDVHTFGAVVLGIFAHTFEISSIHDEQKYYASRMAAKMRQAHNYPYAYLTQKEFGYKSSGIFSDWMYKRFGALAYTFEMRPQFSGYSGFSPPRENILLGGKEGWEGFYKFANDLRYYRYSAPPPPLSCQKLSAFYTLMCCGKLSEETVNTNAIC